MSWAFATIAAALAGVTIWGGDYAGRTIENVFLGAAAAAVILRLAGF